MCYACHTLPQKRGHPGLSFQEIDLHAIYLLCFTLRSRFVLLRSRSAATLGLPHDDKFLRQSFRFYSVFTLPVSQF